MYGNVRLDRALRQSSGKEAMMDERQRNLVLARQFMDADDRNDSVAIANMYAEDGIHIVTGTTAISGVYTKQQMLAAAGGIFAPFPDGLRMKVHSMIADGDRVAVEVESHGRHVSGEVYNQHYFWMLRFRDGEIVESKEYLDTELVTQVLCRQQLTAPAQPFTRQAAD
jgi:ketosteroid isomerase-like protein